jgi:hypothetical protein
LRGKTLPPLDLANYFDFDCMRIPTVKIGMLVAMQLSVMLSKTRTPRNAEEEMDESALAREDHSVRCDLSGGDVLLAFVDFPQRAVTASRRLNEQEQLALALHRTG